MANESGNAYGLSILSPIKNGHIGEMEYADDTRLRIQGLGLNEESPMAQVPNTYLSRMFILDDVILESTPACDFCCTLSDILSVFSDKFRKKALPKEDHLKSKYLVFSSNFHGTLEPYLSGMWEAISDQIRFIWEHCVAFDQVTDAASFITYMKKCQLKTTLFFNGSTDDPLNEQLKSLYLKQEFARFAVEHQGLPAAKLKAAFADFIKRVEPENLAAPTWRPGQSTTENCLYKA